MKHYQTRRKKELFIKALLINREVVKNKIKNIKNEGEVIKENKNKTIKEVVDINVRLYCAKNELYTIQYQINSLILNY